MTAVHDMKYRQGGFTLVEMMVAMLLGIMILMAVSEVFVNNNRTRVAIENTTRQIENGRYAMQLLEGELANAGYFGESSGENFTSLPPACVNTLGEVEASLGVPVFGERAVASGAEPSCLDRFKAGNDYLAVRRSSTCETSIGDCDPFLADAYHLRVSACQVNSPGTLTLGRSEADLLAVKARNCTDPAPTYRYLNRLYYVRDDDVLMRAELADPDGSNVGYIVTPLVDGVERLHFEYGLDYPPLHSRAPVGDEDDGFVDEYLSAPVNSDDWQYVVTVKVWLLARNLESTSDYLDGRTYKIPGLADYIPNDDFKRQLYTAVVRLNNIAGRRESSASAGATGGEEESPAEESPTETPSDPAI